MKTPIELMKSSDIERMNGKSKTHLLNSNAIRKTKSLGSITGLSDLGFQIMAVAPGNEYSEYHRHLYEEQCFYILSGQGEVIIDEKPYFIEAGDFLGFPKNGVAHTIINNSDDDAPPIRTLSYLEPLSKARAGLSYKVFEKTDHGFVYFERGSAGRRATHYAPEIFDLKVDWVKGGFPKFTTEKQPMLRGEWGWCLD